MLFSNNIEASKLNKFNFELSYLKNSFVTEPGNAPYGFGLFTRYEANKDLSINFRFQRFTNSLEITPEIVEGHSGEILVRNNNYEAYADFVLPKIPRQLRFLAGVTVFNVNTSENGLADFLGLQLSYRGESTDSFYGPLVGLNLNQAFGERVEVIFIGKFYPYLVRNDFLKLLEIEFFEIDLSDVESRTTSSGVELEGRFVYRLRRTTSYPLGLYVGYQYRRIDTYYDNYNLGLLGQNTGRIFIGFSFNLRR